MDKFLELIQNKNKKLNILDTFINESKMNLKRIAVDQNIIDNEIADLNEEQNKNNRLISQINKFPQIKKKLRIFVLICFVMMFLLFTFPLIYLAKTVDIAYIALLSLPLDMLIGFIMYKDYKQIINIRIKEIEGFTIDELNKRNIEIEKEKLRLNDEKINNEMLILDINNRLEQYESEKKDLQETINFIENTRNEIIERLCAGILDSEFEREQVKSSFQKIIEPNSKQNNR